MYVRGARNRDEAWLLDCLDDLELEDPAFRSRDYVIALDEVSGSKAGFGRLRLHPNPADPEAVEFTAVGVLPGWRDQGVGAHVLERLVDLARDRGFEEGYVFTSEGGYVTQFGFEAVPEDDLPAVLADRYEAVTDRDPDALAFRVRLAEFDVPDRLRERFKVAESEPEPTDSEESPEDFGIDPDSATYKYDTGKQ